MENYVYNVLPLRMPHAGFSWHDVSWKTLRMRETGGGGETPLTCS